MKRVILTLLLITFIFLIIGCGDENDKKKGTLVVISEPTGASIAINDEPKDEVTPASFELEVGDYTVSASLLGYITDTNEYDVTISENMSDTVFFSFIEDTASGQLLVLSFPTDAEILVNDIPTGSYTPATISLSAGTYEIGVNLCGFAISNSEVTIAANDNDTLNLGDLSPKKMVLLEEYTNVNCGECVDVAEAVSEVRPNFGDSLVFIEWHPFIAVVAHDPFNLYNPDEHNDRAIDYYGMGSLPHIKLDGTEVASPDDETILTSAISSAFGEDVQTAIWGSVANTGGTEYTASVQVKPVSSFTAKLFCVLYREHTHFDSAPGTNGLTDFHHVMYDVEPSIDPDNSTFTTDEISNFSFTFDIPDTLHGEMGVAVFIQDAEKNVYGANYIRFNE